MVYIDNFQPENNNDVISYANSEEYKILIQESKNYDRGYNKVFRTLTQKNGKLKRTKIEFYTSGDTGCNIRDAETGEYTSYKVGSLNEDLFFKVILATGECKSRNKSSTLFYSSPEAYMSHMHCELDTKLVEYWEEKYQARLNKTKFEKKAPAKLAVTVHYNICL